MECNDNNMLSGGIVMMRWEERYIFEVEEECEIDWRWCEEGR